MDSCFRAPVTVSLVDYGAGNLRSVANALEFCGIPWRMVKTPQEITSSEKLLLPGVGSYRQAMENLSTHGLAEAIVSVVRQGMPVLGICLGMQLLAETGEEGGGGPGLGLIRGAVRRIRGEPGLRIPHMGFNSVQQKIAHPVFAGIRDGSDFYFAHSYHFDAPPEKIIGAMEHGGWLAAVVAEGAVWGTQFHPEKSQGNGLQVLRNFARPPAC